jgi:glycosyltransferase involved in cell wall biosynthesis
MNMAEPNDEGASDVAGLAGALQTEAIGRWTGLSTDVELLGHTGADGRAGRIAIASYEFVGVVRNGGIGTACTELALALANDGHEVDLIFTGWDEGPDTSRFSEWRRRYRERGVRLVRVDTDLLSRCDVVVGSAAQSMALYQLLKARDQERPYDVVHFPESLGHGFFSLLAKRQGLAFHRATTAVGTHSPRRWLAEAHGAPFDHPDQIGDEFLENRCIELADVVISPSAHLLDWLQARGVRLPQRSYVQQYVTDFEPLIRTKAPKPVPVEELVFFGRLEPRKGIVEFCDALDLLADGPYAQLRRVTFLGKEAVSPDFIPDRATEWPWDWKVISNLDREAALKYLRVPGRLAVMASTMDNSPNAVYEAIGLDIPFLASRAGGTGELVHPRDLERVTYDPRDLGKHEIDPGNPARTRPRHSGQVLSRRLREALASEPRPADFAVCPVANRDAHLAWHRAVCANRPPEKPPPETPVVWISVLDLPEVEANGDEPLLVLDSDVEGSPRLEGSLADAAAACPDAAFVTSLGSFDVKTPETLDNRLFLPTGGPAAAGLFGNCAGAGAVLARREALERIGAFDDPDQVPLSVSELLSRAVLAGERVDVVPEVLYHLPASVAPGGWLSRAQEPFELLRPYYMALPSQAHDFTASAARVLREEPGLRDAARHSVTVAAELERVSSQLDVVSSQLAEILSSRSLRMTAPLRRAGATARRWTRKRKT